MKYEAHIQTGPFSFIGFTDLEGTAEEAAQAYRGLEPSLSTGNYGPGIDKKDFNKFIDDMLGRQGIPNGADLYAQMNSIQQFTVQELKRGLARIKNDNK